MLTPINERSERALERWEKLRKSLKKAVNVVRPVKKGRFTIEPAMSASPRTRSRTLKPGKYGRFEVVNVRPKSARAPNKNMRNYLLRKRNKIQKAINSVRNANRSRYQQELQKLKEKHKAELNIIEKRHHQNEDNLYNKHFSQGNKKITQLIQAINNLNRRLA